MAVKPINFKPYQVLAALNGRLSQGRLVLNPQPRAECGGFQKVFGEPPYFESLNRSGRPIYAFPASDGCVTGYPNIRYAVGDILYARECFALHSCAKEAVHGKGDDHPWGSPIYKATFGAALNPICEGFSKWKPSIHMPRWASRLTLEVADVRVQRIQDISEEDARAEGITVLPLQSADDPSAWWQSAPGKDQARTARDSFRSLWDSLHGEGAWLRNDWVAAYTFSVHHGNVDDLLRQRAAA